MVAGGPFNLLFRRIPERPLCADYPIRGCRRTPKDYATQERPIIQINRATSTHTLVFDIDRPLSAAQIDRLPGNIAAINPRNGHVHLFTILENWVRHDESKAHKLLRLVDDGLTARLRADTGYTGLLAKNPFHASWECRLIREKPWTLGELRALLPLTTTKKHWKGSGFISPTEVQEGCRNQTLFQMCRRHVMMCGENVFEFALRYNSRMPQPLPTSEALRVARSVFKWSDGRSVWMPFARLQKARAHIRWDRLNPVLRDEWRTSIATRERPWLKARVSKATWYRRRSRARYPIMVSAIRKESLDCPIVPLSGASVRLPSSDSSRSTPVLTPTREYVLQPCRKPPQDST